ncbi:MAG TPA: hypothetical protein DDZ88_13420 [Verrucomicrobiales bacterium]|nr:hypothetical protein [Verrucomicrobiales bacterium]
MQTLPALRICICFAAIVFTCPAALSQTAVAPEVAELQAKYDEKVKLDVLRPHELAVADLNAKFAAALDRAQEAAQKKGSLDDAFAIKTEKEAILSGKYVPAQDDAKTPAGLKTMRATYRAALGRLELDRDKKLRPLKEVYAKSLEALMLTMTKGGKLEEAMALKKMREDLLTNLVASGADTRTEANAISAPSEKSLTNSLSMKFVPLAGTNVFFCIHETRYKDYAAYAAEEPGVDETWKDQSTDGFTPTDRPEEHPVTKVSWEDTQKFCAWLSKKEGKTYRLPTDQEWSYAVGIGRDENRKKDTTPDTVFKSQTDFPWGGEWPPPKDSGNYSDQSRKQKAPNSIAVYLDGYDDGFPTTAPVMSFKPNKLGLYDMDGNVREQCEDWFDNAKEDHVLRGGCWYDGVRANLLSSGRFHRNPDFRSHHYGFRVVMVESAP